MLKKSREYQARKLSAAVVEAEFPSDEELQAMLLSEQGRQKFPKTSALLETNKAQAAAASAIGKIVAELQARFAHKQTIIGKLRGKISVKEFQSFFTSFSERYARKALAVQKKVLEGRAKGEKPDKVDIFEQKRTTDESREAFSQWEKKASARIVLENISAKSG